MAAQENAVAAEVAEMEFSRFCEALDLDVEDLDAFDKDDRKSFEENRKTMIREIMRGSLTIDDEGLPTYTPRRSDCGAIRFERPTGATLMAMDDYKKDHDVHKMFGCLGSITKRRAQTFAKMDFRTDLRVCQAIFVLFLG